MKGRLVSYLALIAMLGGTAFGQSNGDSKGGGKNLLQRQARLSQLDKVTLQDAFMEALGSTYVPGGIVLARNCDEDATYQLNMSSTSLRNVLDSITMAAPSYRWTIQNGVVNLTPAGGDTPLLALKIERFEVKQAKSLDQACDELLQLPEVRQRMTELNIEIRRQLGISILKRPGSISDDDQEGFSVTCNDITLREALNAIVRARGWGVWAYSERHCNGKDDVSLSFIVR